MICRSSTEVVMTAALNYLILGTTTTISSRLEFYAATVACSASVGLSSYTAGTKNICSELSSMTGIYEEISR